MHFYKDFAQLWIHIFISNIFSYFIIKYCVYCKKYLYNFFKTILKIIIIYLRKSYKKFLLMLIILNSFY